MTTLTIELPETLAEQVETRGISPQRLEKVIIHLVQIYLQEYDKASGSSETSLSTSPLTWSDGESFARRMIANNRELFEELARL